MISHERIIYVKVIKKDMRDLEFSSSGRRGNGGLKAPKRILGAEVIFIAFWLQKVQNLVRNEKISKNCTFYTTTQKDL